MSDAAESKYAPPDFGTEPDRCPVRSGGSRCVFHDDHERHQTESGWSWYANRPQDVNEAMNRLRAELAAAEARAEAAERMHDELLGATDLLAAERAKSKALAEALERVTNEGRAFLSDHPDPCITNTRCFERAIEDARAALALTRESAPKPNSIDTSAERVRDPRIGSGLVGLKTCSSPGCHHVFIGAWERTICGYCAAKEMARAPRADTTEGSEE